MIKIVDVNNINNKSKNESNNQFVFFIK